jgi:hypothetical protein
MQPQYVLGWKPVNKKESKAVTIQLIGAVERCPTKNHELRRQKTGRAIQPQRRQDTKNTEQNNIFFLCLCVFVVKGFFFDFAVLSSLEYQNAYQRRVGLSRQYPYGERRVIRSISRT